MKFNLPKLFVIIATLGLSSLTSAFTPEQKITVVSPDHAAPVVWADDEKDDDKKKK